MTTADMKLLGNIAANLMLDTPLTFGKHKGKTYGELLTFESGVGYLRYLARSKDSSTSLPAKEALKQIKRKKKNAIN